MAIGDRNWTLNQLRHARNSFLYTLSGMRLLNGDLAESLRGKILLLKVDGVIWDPDQGDRVGERFEFDASQVTDEYKNRRSDFDESLEELYKFLRRNLIRESFDAVKVFAEVNGVKNELQNQSWYHFARVLRNAVVHNFMIEFDKHARAALPIEWNGRFIEASMEGTEIRSDILNPLTTIDLIVAMHTFVNAK